MRRLISQSTLLACVLVGVGCQTHKSMVDTKQPPDPLLISKKPVEGKQTSFTPMATTWREPQPPGIPNAVVQQPVISRPVPVGYRQDDVPASIGKPRGTADGQ